MAEEPDSPAWRGMLVSYDSLKPCAGSGVAVAAQCSWNWRAREAVACQVAVAWTGATRAILARHAPWRRWPTAGARRRKSRCATRALRRRASAGGRGGSVTLRAHSHAARARLRGRPGPRSPAGRAAGAARSSRAPPASASPAHDARADSVRGRAPADAAAAAQLARAAPRLGVVVLHRHGDGLAMIPVCTAQRSRCRIRGGCATASSRADERT